MELSQPAVLSCILSPAADGSSHCVLIVVTQGLSALSLRYDCAAPRHLVTRSTLGFLGRAPDTLERQIVQLLQRTAERHAIPARGLRIGDRL